MSSTLRPTTRSFKHLLSTCSLPILAIAIFSWSSEPALPDEPATAIAIHAGAEIRFASVMDGTAIMGHRDEFVQSMSPIDRRLRLQSEQPIDPSQYLEFAQKQVRAWDPAEEARLAKITRSLAPRVARFTRQLPAQIHLVKTTGQEENGAPHCRGNAIVLPARSLQQNDADLERLLAHELFHILSRQSKELRKELYALIGFQLVNPISLPPALAERKLTNPDAPEINCVMHIRHGDRELFVTPLLITRQEHYESLNERTLFSELLFRLLVVQPDGGQFRVDDAAAPQKTVDLLSHEELPDFTRQIGRNTGYIIHPEEILAENFVHLVMATTELPDPRIVERLGELLTRPE